MGFQLDFMGGQVRGSGSDDIGGFSWSGSYSTERLCCEMTKQYFGSHSAWYQGKVDENGIWRTGLLAGGSLIALVASNPMYPAFCAQTVEGKDDAYALVHSSGEWVPSTGDYQADHTKYSSQVFGYRLQGAEYCWFYTYLLVGTSILFPMLFWKRLLGKKPASAGNNIQVTVKVGLGLILPGIIVLSMSSARVESTARRIYLSIKFRSDVCRLLSYATPRNQAW